MLPGAHVFINGAPVDAASAVVSVFDHGFLFGDSIYEVLRTYAGRPFAVGPHLDRLAASADRIALALPMERATWEAEINRALATIDGEGYLRIIVTRGVGPLSFDPAGCAPARIFIAMPLPLPPESWFAQGVGVRLASVRRNDRRALDPAVKTGNYLNNVLAFIEAKAAGDADAIFVNGAGDLTEATASNLWWTDGHALFTPALDTGILAGVTRRLLIDALRAAGETVHEVHAGPEHLFAAREAFVSSTIREVLPIVRVNGLPVGAGVPGPVVARVRAVWHERVVNPFLSAAR